MVIKMISLEGKTLTSANLTYRLLEERDKKSLATILKSNKITEPAGFLPSKNDAEFDAFFDELTMYNTGIAVLHNSELIGYLHVNKYSGNAPEFKDKRCVDVGFVIGEKFQGRGFGTEMLITLTDYLLSVFDYCFADCFAENVISEKTIRKCGYRYVESYSMYFDSLGKEKTCHSFVKSNN